MKVVLNGLLLGLISVSLPLAAQQSGDSGSSSGQDQNSQNMQKLVQYAQNFGSYFGFDLTTVPAPPFSLDLLTSDSSTSTSPTPDALIPEQYLFNAVLGAIPVNTLLGASASPSLANFVLLPSGTTVPTFLNGAANKVFPSYTSTGISVAVNPKLDVADFQPDPVNQAVLNLLGTPSPTYCMSNDESTVVSKCPFTTTQSSVINYVIGPTPNPTDFFSSAWNQQVIPQLNGNALIGPMLYTINQSGGGGSGGGTSGSGGDDSQQKGPLQAQDQGQLAANFIRYASGSVLPLPLASKSEYSSLFDVIGSNKTPVVQATAQTTLNNYLASLRVYAAQLSVGYSNLYYIMGKRMPQNQGGDSTTNTSQALSEFNMATRRIYNPNSQSGSNTQWLEEIGGASPATIQKEMAILLAEINYQLYLNRQQDERLLLTNTMLLLQNARGVQPSLSSSTASATSD